jgi:hypothetical protein
MAKQGIFTGSSPNDGTGDSLALGAVKVNQNFNEIYSTFGNGSNLISYVNTAGVATVAGNLTGNPSISVTKIVAAGTSNFIPFLWDNYADLPNANYHGVVAHVHETGKLYYGHGRWIEVVNRESDQTIGTGTENYRVGVLTAGFLYGDGSNLTNLPGGGGGIGTDGSVNTTGIITASAFVGDGSGLTGISADSAWVNINLPGDFFGDYGQPLGIHTTKHVGIGTTADSATVLSVESNTVGSAGTPWAMKVYGRTLIGNAFFGETSEGFARFSFPVNIVTVSGGGNGYYSALQYDMLDTVPFDINTHSKFRRTVQIGTSFYDIGDGPVLYPGIFMDGGTATIAVGLGITINGGTGIITAIGFSGGAGGVNVSGAITATSFSGDGSGLTGISTFSGDYNDLTNQPSIPSISGLASEGYVDSATSNSANWDTAYSWGNHATAGYLTTAFAINDLSDVNAGAPSTGQVLKWSGTEWQAASDLTAAGAGIGLSDLSVTITSPGISSLTYNNTTGVFLFTPTNLSGYATTSSIVGFITSGALTGYATTGYVTTQIGLNTFTGAATTITSGQISNWNTAYSWGNHASAGYLTNVNITAGSNITVLETSEGNFIITSTSVAGAGGTWAVNAAGIHTTKNVGIGTALSSSALTVEGDGRFSGVVTATRFESTSAGTPTIDSPNNLNINAVTVAISTDTTVGKELRVAGITTVNAGGIRVAGVVTATTFSGSGANLTNLPSGQLTGALPAIDGSALTNLPAASVPANLSVSQINVSGLSTFAGITTVTGTTFYAKNIDITGNTRVTGVSTATSFRTNSTVGDGSDVGFAIRYYVTANGSGSYRFAGPGLLNTMDNPTFYLQRGFTYIFENSTGGAHPFRIQFTGTTIGVGTYVSGSQTGTQVFTIPFNAPSSYEYQCTLHTLMLGTFNIV